MRARAVKAGHWPLPQQDAIPVGYKYSTQTQMLLYHLELESLWKSSLHEFRPEILSLNSSEVDRWVIEISLSPIFFFFLFLYCLRYFKSFPLANYFALYFAFCKKLLVWMFLSWHKATSACRSHSDYAFDNYIADDTVYICTKLLNHFFCKRILQKDLWFPWSSPGYLFFFLADFVGRNLHSARPLLSSASLQIVSPALPYLYYIYCT